MHLSTNSTPDNKQFKLLSIFRTTDFFPGPASFFGPVRPPSGQLGLTRPVGPRQAKSGLVRPTGRHIRPEPGPDSTDLVELTHKPESDRAGSIPSLLHTIPDILTVSTIIEFYPQEVNADIKLTKKSDLSYAN